MEERRYIVRIHIYVCIKYWKMYTDSYTQQCTEKMSASAITPNFVM